jgi:hypothetical protein
MNKLTILLIIIAILLSGVGGFILGAQNSQLIPTVNVVNNTTDDSDYSTNYTSKSTKTTTKPKTNTTVKKNTTTNSTPKTNSSPSNSTQ